MARSPWRKKRRRGAYGGKKERRHHHRASSAARAAATAAKAAPHAPSDPRAAADDADADTDVAISAFLLVIACLATLAIRSLRARLFAAANVAWCTLSLACALTLRWQGRRRQGGGGFSPSCLRRRRRRRGALAVAVRLANAVFCNLVVAGGKTFPSVSRFGFLFR